jgi:hypothetical protein
MSGGPLQLRAANATGTVESEQSNACSTQGYDSAAALGRAIATRRDDRRDSVVRAVSLN